MIAERSNSSVRSLHDFSNAGSIQRDGGSSFSVRFVSSSVNSRDSEASNPERLRRRFERGFEFSVRINLYISIAIFFAINIPTRPD